MKNKSQCAAAATISISVLFAVLTAVILVDSPAWASDWSMAGHDPAHTGWNRTEIDLAPPFVDVEYPMLPHTAGLSAHDGIAYLTCREDTNSVVAMAIETGGILWETLIPGSGGSASNTAAIADTLLYVGGQHGDALLCLDTRDGHIVWQREMGSLYMLQPVLQDGEIYTNAWHDSLYALDARTGSTLWGRPSSGSPTPAVVGDTLFAAVGPDSLYALNRCSGSPFWGVCLPVARCFLITRYSLLYFRSGLDTVHAVRRRDGSVKWARTFPGESISDDTCGPFAIADGALYVSIWTDGAGFGRVYRLDAWTGGTEWEHVFDQEGTFTPVVANGLLYVGTWGGQTWDALEIYVLSAETGDEVDHFPGMGANYIVSEGSLIVRGISDNGGIMNANTTVLGKGPSSGPDRPRGTCLGQNAPNPVNPSTRISYRVATKGARVKITVFDLRGRCVRTLVDGYRPSGDHVVVWNGRDDDGRTAPSGVYLYRMSTSDSKSPGTASTTRKMVLRK